jgi:hypothetical protein
MAWTAPMTAVAGAVYTAAQFNTFVRDNLNETCPAKATTAGSYFVTSGTNQISERVVQQAIVNQQDSTTQTTYADMDDTVPTGGVPAAGPSVTVFSGSTCLVVVGGRIGGGLSATQSVKMSWEVSGATSITAADAWAAGEVGLGSSGFAYDSRAYLATGLTQGLNTFTAKYAVSSSQGFASVRSILVMPF